MAKAWKNDPVRQPAQGQGTKQKSKRVQPVISLIHENLQSAWSTHPKHEMCFIFDSVSPARQFQRGTPYSDDIDFPEPGRTTPDDLTETDDPESGGWMPYMSRSYTCVPFPS